MPSGGARPTGESWLPPARERAVVDEDWDPWVPKAVAEARVDPETLSYIVVDEIEDGVALFVVTRWPRVDGHGRLRFADRDDRWTVASRADAVEKRLDARLVSPPPDLVASEALTSRPLRVGDVFGAVTRRPKDDTGRPRSPAWMRPPIVDVTAAAREATKLQFFAAMSPPLKPELLDQAAEDFFADDLEADG